MFKMFADLIGFHLDAADRLAASEAALLDEREAAELREQFIAVLGHDLRNPLAAVAAGVTLLGKPQPRGARRLILGQMQGSVDRMAKLIDNMLDFARGRLGGGLPLQRRLVDIDPVLQQVVAELAGSHPEPRDRARTARPARPALCDPDRIAQLLSNLVGNALTHGAPDVPVEVRCATDGGEF